MIYSSPTCVLLCEANKKKEILETGKFLYHSIIGTALVYFGKCWYNSFPNFID